MLGGPRGPKSLYRREAGSRAALSRGLSALSRGQDGPSALHGDGLLLQVLQAGRVVAQEPPVGGDAVAEVAGVVGAGTSAPPMLARWGAACFTARNHWCVR